MGKSKSINEVLKIAKGEMFFVMDADIMLPKDCLKKLVEMMGKGVGAAVSTVVLYDKSNFWQKIQKVEYNLSGLYRYLSGTQNGLFLTHGGGSLFKTKLLKKIGGFDEQNPTEDLEIGLRIIKNGYSVVACSGVLGKTNAPDNLKDLYKQRIRWNVGFIHNFVMYWNMIKKNIKSNWVFFMVINIFWVLLASFLILNTADDIRVNFLRTFRNLVFTDWDFGFYFRQLWEHTITVSRINIVTVISGLSLLIFFGNYYLASRKISGQGPLSWLFLILFFGPYIILNTFFWMISAIRFVFKRQRLKWKGVEVAG